MLVQCGTVSPSVATRIGRVSLVRGMGSFKQIWLGSTNYPNSDV